MVALYWPTGAKIEKLYNEAQKAYEEGNYIKAIDRYNSENKKALIAIVDLFGLDGEDEKALKAVDEAYRIYPNDADILSRKAMLAKNSMGKRFLKNPKRELTD